MFALAPKSIFGSAEHVLVHAFRCTPNVNQAAFPLRPGSSVIRASYVASARCDKLFMHRRLPQETAIKTRSFHAL